MLSAYVAAEIAVLHGQAYTIGARAMRRADLPEIRKGRQEWQATVDQLTAGGRGMRIRGATPTD
jgi:hypothetical protein